MYHDLSEVRKLLYLIEKKINLILIQEHPRRLIPELCKQFYDLGWVTGTGGGISIKLDDEIYIAPSSVQKERIQIDDLFIQNIDGDDIVTPPEYKKLKKSQCTPLFMVSFKKISYFHFLSQIS